MAGTRVLILSSTADDHATSVMSALQHRHGIDAVLLDTATFPATATMSLGLGDGAELSARFDTASGRATDLGDVGVAWWRRPEPFQLDASITDPVHRRFAWAESMHAVMGLWSALDTDWVNDPARDDEAGRKPHQLAVAARLGWHIPDTLITNDPDAARAFVARVGRENCVYKAFQGTEEAWRETRVLRPEEAAGLDAVRFAPVILQRYVPAVRDVRVTVMGGEVFASAVHTDAAPYQADYRADLGVVPVSAHVLPSDVRRRCLALTRRLGLVYGAIDLRLTPEGRYVFLEINPSGQWRFMEERTGQPMTDAFADLLAALACHPGDIRDRGAAVMAAGRT